MADKKALRAQYLSCREAQSVAEQEEKSRRIMARLQETDIFLRAHLILVYMDFGSEVRTTPLVAELLQKKEKRVFCPRVDETEMDFYEITDLNQLARGYKGIREPAPQPELRFGEAQCHRYFCLMLIPGVAFDCSGGRIGYGKGYYDRFLARYPELPTVALAYDCQIVPAVPLAAYDQKTGIVITESEIIYG